MDKKIAVISVSNSLTKAVKNCMERRNVEYPIFEANMDKALSVAKRLHQEGYNVFISRGRTSTYLRERISATVINIRTSDFGYASAVNSLKENYGVESIAILGFSDQFKHMAIKHGKLMGDGVVFRSFEWRGKTDDELKREFAVELEKLKLIGIKGIVGNSTICQIASSMGFYTASQLPDEDMIEAAFDEAEHVAKFFAERDEKEQTILAFLNAVSEILLKIDTNGIITDFNPAAQRLFKLNGSGVRVDNLLSGLDWYKFSSQRMSWREKVFRFNDNDLVVDLSPIFTNAGFSGAILTAQRVAHIQKLEHNIRSKLVQKGLVAKISFSDILGVSPQIKQTIDWAKRIALSDGTVLISGDTGTGKELFAQSIHNYSSRMNSPFVAINCAAISPNVLESELFGYVRGAFTGALSEGKQGIFELAHTGTIFLDEIGELPFDIQAKLLRVIQEREVIRIGDNKVLPIDVRIIAATNRNLEEEVSQNRFRSDLYYRLNVLKLSLPVLDERKQDIPIMAEQFLRQLNPIRKFSPDAMELMMSMSWPGNVRQLRNLIERANVFVDHDTIRSDDIMMLVGTIKKNALPDRQPSSNNIDDDFKEQIRYAITTSCGNREQAAKMLGISTVTLWRKIKKIVADDPDFAKQINFNPINQ